MGRNSKDSLHLFKCQAGGRPTENAGMGPADPSSCSLAASSGARCFFTSTPQPEAAYFSYCCGVGREGPGKSENEVGKNNLNPVHERPHPSRTGRGYEWVLSHL